MADIKKIFARKKNTTYDIKDEVARTTKQDKIENVSVAYTEDGGNPNASVQFSGGNLAFLLKNLKLKFSDLTAADKEEITGPKGETGDSAVYDPSDPDAPDFVMANTTGQSTTKAMTQKAVTEQLDYIIGMIPFIDVEEDGFFVVDENYYIGLAVTADGVKGKNLVNYK